MIKYIKEQDILKAQTQVIVSSVTTAGAMAEGLSAQVAKAYPDVEAEYKAALAQGSLDIGKVWAVQPQGAPYVVVLFPTSKEASRRSDLEYIRQGLVSLKEVITGHDFKSVAMPKLGTAVGGLEWDHVKELIVDTFLDEIDNIELQIYE